MFKLSEYHTSSLYDLDKKRLVLVRPISQLMTHLTTNKQGCPMATSHLKDHLQGQGFQ